MKDAIRNALQKGNAHDRAFREKVYRQAFAALERSLQGRPNIAPEEVHRRREQLKGAIIEIEREFLTAASPPSQPPSPEADPPPVEPVSSGYDHDLSPRLDHGDLVQQEIAAAPAGEMRTPLVAGRRRRPLILLAVIAALIAAIGLGMWWIIGGVPQLGGPHQSNPPAQAAGDDSAAPPVAAGDSAQEEDWISVFTPDDPTAVTAPAGASAEASTSAGNEPFLRISSGNADASVSFDVGQGVLEQLAGKHAIFSLRARAEGGETQISISCDFGASVECGRTRYEVGAQPSEYLFEVQFPDQAVSGGGAISITPDVEGQGRPLDVFSLRVMAVE